MNLKLFNNILILILFISCGGAGDSNTLTTSNTTSLTPEWTIFVYGHADHNLSYSMLLDLQEMQQASLNSSVKLIAAVDLDSSQTIPGTTDHYPSGTIVYEFTGNGQYKTIETLAEENFDDPAVLRDHVISAFEKYPSKKRGVILWDHGGSWDGGFGSDTQNGTVTPTPMSIFQVKQALSQAATSLNLFGTPFDFLAFDTCLMGNIETAYELKDLAKYYFASAEIDYGAGWDYTNAMNVFTASPQSSIASLASQIVTTWDNHHKTEGPSDKNFRTQIALDFTNLDSIANQVSTFVTTLSNSNFPKADWAKYISRSSPGFNVGLNGQSNYKDFGHILSLFKNSTDSSVNSIATSLKSQINGSIKAKSIGDTRISSQIGLSAESALATQWSASRRSNYSLLSWNQTTSWGSLLDNLKTSYAQDSGAPTLTTSSINTTNPSSLNLPTINFVTQNSDVDRAIIYTFKKYGPGWKMLGFNGHGFVDNNQTYSFTWDGKNIKITNGINSSDVTLEIMALPGQDSLGNAIGGIFQIGGKLVKGGTYINCLLSGSGDNSSLSEIIIQSSTSSGSLTETHSISELSGQGYSFVPQIYYLDANSNSSYINGTSIALTTGMTGINVTSQSATAGDYLLVTELIDVWGKISTSGDTVTIVTPF